MERIKCYLRIGFLVVAIVMILISMAIAQSEVSQGEKEIKTEQILDLQVINKAAGEPISDAELDIRIMSEHRKDKTDNEGRCRIVLGGKTPEYVRVEVRKDGFVPIRLSWRQTVSHPVMPDQNKTRRSCYLYQNINRSRHHPQFNCNLKRFNTWKYL